MKTNTRKIFRKKIVNRRSVNFNAKLLTLADFTGMSEKDIRKKIVDDYEITDGELDKYKLLIVHKEEDSYEGYSHLLLQDKESGKLYANYASHCSCYGYEGQFKPEETTVEFLTGPYEAWYKDTPEVVKWMKENFRLTKSHKSV